MHFYLNVYTHVDDRAVAGQAGAVFILGHHQDGVLIAAAKVVPGAVAVVAVTPVAVSIKTDGFCGVRFGAITGPPINGGCVCPALLLGHHITRDAWSCGWRRDFKTQSQMQLSILMR